MKEKEIWQPVPGYEGYEASNLGEIRSLNYQRTGKVKVLKPGIKRGYYCVTLCKDNKTKQLYIHRLVWISFNGEIPKAMQINHLNENKQDNRLENLELVTPKQNVNHGTRNERTAKALTGIKRKPFTEEHKAKLGAWMKGKTPWIKGKKHSEETKAKMRAAHKARREKSLRN